MNHALPSLTDMATEFPPHQTIARLALAANGFVFDPLTGASFTANTTGLAILQFLQQDHRSLPDITALLAERFEAPESALEHDVIEFAARLRDIFR